MVAVAKKVGEGVFPRNDVGEGDAAGSRGSRPTAWAQAGIGVVVCRQSLSTDESQVLWTVDGSFAIVVVGCG
jgi:hypothetical protein